MARDFRLSHSVRRFEWMPFSFFVHRWRSVSSSGKATMKTNPPSLLSDPYSHVIVPAMRSSKYLLSPIEIPVLKSPFVLLYRPRHWSPPTHQRTSRPYPRWETVCLSSVHRKPIEQRWSTMKIIPTCPPIFTRRLNQLRRALGRARFPCINYPHRPKSASKHRHRLPKVHKVRSCPFNQRFVPVFRSTYPRVARSINRPTPTRFGSIRSSPRSSSWPSATDGTSYAIGLEKCSRATFNRSPPRSVRISMPIRVESIPSRIWTSHPARSVVKLCSVSFLPSIVSGFVWPWKFSFPSTLKTISRWN